MNRKDNPPDCPLCHSSGDTFRARDYYKCRQCGGIYLDSEQYPDANEERARYETHNNDVDDPRYRKFVSPITTAVEANYGPETLGLDYGAGTGPVITQVLSEKGYHLKLYDPFFHPNKEYLENRYDYIVCCEVIEHFHSPDSEFRKLRDLLNPGGSLFCMTEIYHSDIDFENWYYRRDPTHVFFYTEATFLWIKQTYGFVNLVIAGRFVTLKAE